MGDGCLVSGTFGVVVPPGTYQVRLFTLAGTPSAPVATPVARKTLTVAAE